MKATVKVVNPTRGMFAAKTQDGDFVVFELLDSVELQIDDVVSHRDFHALGGETYRNETQGINISVHVENIVASLEQARRQCFL